MDRAFASLTPVNAVAKIAFNEVFESSLRRPSLQPEHTSSPAQRMRVLEQQQYHQDVAQLRFDQES
jgi:hypothetical protein